MVLSYLTHSSRDWVDVSDELAYNAVTDSENEFD